MPAVRIVGRLLKVFSNDGRFVAMTPLTRAIESPDSTLISVIIPSFNRCRMVSQAIDSVLNQSFKDFELIVVDDGSTDATRDILDVYRERIKVCYQPNRGVSSARNTGLRMAKGEWIAFLDSDDLWLPEKLSVQVNFFRNHPEALICQTEETWIRRDVRVNPKKKHKKPSGMIYEPSLGLCLVSPSAVMIKKELFHRVGLFDEDLPACEDYDLWLRIACRFPIHLIDQPLILKRGGHDDQLSRSPCLDKYRIQSLQKMIQSDWLSEKQRNATQKILREKCRIYANGCQKRGRAEEAQHFFKMAGDE
jgi:glycosyltransferase involved in cell wall biosynthesis